MSNREKLLGFATGGLLALFALYGIYSMVSGRLNKKANEVVNLDTQIRRAKLDNGKSLRAQKLLYEFRKRSLTAEPHIANLQFIQWLETQVKAAGLHKPTVRFQGIPNTKSPYKELTYNVSGSGNIKQLTTFLYNIHSTDTLHRVRSFSVRKQKNTKQLKLDFVVDALSMEEIDRKQLQERMGTKLTPERLAEMISKIPVGTQSEEKLAFSLDEYGSQITSRNSFSRANLPPKLTSSTTQQVEVGKRLSVSLEAKDPEEDDVAFELDEDAPEAAKISESGRLTWLPKELGDYEFKVYLTDTGIPAKETIATINVKVIPEVIPDEPEREDPFDAAKLAVMTAIVQGPKSPKPQMCMYLRSEDEYQYLAAGDDIEIGEWSGVVISVDPDHSRARIQTDDGDYVLLLGQALADAKFVKADTDTKDKRL